MAGQCRNFVCEILDENGTVLLTGKRPNCNTSLFNRAHPFIRYDIGDIGILDEKVQQTYFEATNWPNQ
jgi:phenylacetate-coenzyme A ligase PaaK-like adenylate-forming protein